MVTGNLLVVTLRVDLSDAGTSGQSVEAVALEDSVHSGIRDPDPMIALEIPDDADWSQMVLAA